MLSYQVKAKALLFLQNKILKIKNCLNCHKISKKVLFLKQKGEIKVEPERRHHFFRKNKIRKTGNKTSKSRGK